jgi:glycosyltransferase involved in cell wall biosynthesis
VPAQKIKVTYPPVDTSIYRPLDKSKVRQTLGISRDSKVVLYMGSLKEGRFPLLAIVQTLSEMVRELASVVLLVAVLDRPEERERAKQLVRAAEKCGVSGRILLQIKNLSDAEKNVLYALSDLFIYPASEPFMAIEPPLTVLESMASGTPILACREPSVRELIEDPECGEMADCCQASLSRALVALLSDEGRLATLSTNCRKVARAKFSLKASGASLLEWYMEILEGTRT